MAPVNLSNGMEVEVPRTTVALVQNEAETLRTPNRDLRSVFLGCEDRWHVQPFGERSFRAALPTTDLYDGLVFGYNAIHESQDLKQALRETPPTCHMVILHQYALDCLEFLQGDMALRLRALDGGGDEAKPPSELFADDEVLLNWPHQIRRLQGKDCQALRYFEFRPDSAWRVVLEVETQRRRVPVLVRTAATTPLRIVACSLLLDVQNEVHRQVIENLLTYGMLGRPRIAVLDPPGAVDGYVATRLAAKLRLQGASTMVVRPGTAEVQVGAWPLRVAERVVIPARADGTPNPALQEPTALKARAQTERWKKAGGAIVEIDADGTAIAHMEMEDTHAIARRWAAWFHGEPESSWATRTFQLRAVLRMLDAISEKQRMPLELQGPEAYADMARELLASRVANGNLEGTIGTTAAAYEIDRLVGGCVPDRPGKSSRSMRKWLREQVEEKRGRTRVQRSETPLEERLDVARALADPELLARVLASIGAGTPLNATVVIRLWEAAVACKADAASWKPELLKIDSERFDSAALARELDGHLLASAEFVAAAAAFVQEFGSDAELTAYTAHALENEAAVVAIATLARIGSLAQGQPQGRRSAQEVSAEALALHRYMGADKSSTFQIWPQATEIPAKAVESVLRELAKARARRDEVEKDRAALGLAVPVMAGISIGTVAAVLYGQANESKGLHVHWQLPVLGWILPTVALFGLWFLLDRRASDHRDVQLARHAVTLLSLLATFVAGLWVTTHLVHLGSTLSTIAVFALPTVAIWLLGRFDLIAGWAPDLLDLITSPSDTVAALRRRLPGGARADGTPAPSDVSPSESD
jgi:hypothetical protein